MDLEWAKEVVANKPAKLYLFYGVEEYRKEEAIRWLAAKLPSFKKQTIDLEEQPFEKLIQALQQCSLVSGERRLIIARNAKKYITGAQANLEQLFNCLEHVDMKHMLVLNVSHAGAGNISKAKLRERGILAWLVNFKPLTRIECQTWVKKEFKKNTLEIDPLAVAELIESVGNDLFFLAQEIRKISTYCGDSTNVTQEIVQELASSNVTDVFGFIKLVANRKIQEASLLWEKLKQAGAQPNYALALLVRQFRLVFLARILLDQGRTKEEFTAQFQLHPYVGSEIFKVATGYKFQELSTLFYKLLQIDGERKRCRVTTDNCIELFLLNS
ncbi:MAG: hypothetical protein RLZ12_349 [Bacillota bacterium]|jgi:DNA polymerase-3 subunit delta